MSAQICVCGHLKERHAGPTHRGTCYPCYSASGSQYAAGRGDAAIFLRNRAAELRGGEPQ